MMSNHGTRDERQRMHRQRIIIMVAGAAGMLGVLLPWMNAPLVGSLPGTSAPHGTGWIALGLAALALAGAVGRDAMKVPARLISGCAGAGMSGIAVWQIVTVLRAKAEIRAEGAPFGDAMAQAVNVGAGAYLTVASGLVIIGTTCFVRSREEVQPHAPRGEVPPRAAPWAHFWICLVIGLAAGASAVYFLVGPRPTRERADAPRLSECDARDGLRLCAEGFAQRRSIAGPLGRSVAEPGTSFVLVQASLHANETIGVIAVDASSFGMRDHEGNTWDPDVDAQRLARWSGLEFLNYVPVPPGGSVRGWLVFVMPDSAIGSARLTLQHKRGELTAELPARRGCVVERREGTCLDTARCEGIKVPGLCDGPGSVQCCLR